MEFHEKLQELRKRKGLTQEELAAVLYVSRTAVSKWEAGRGYPNIDSLKAIASFYHVTIDALLSSNELLVLAEADTKQRETHVRDLSFGLLDCSAILFFFMPFFGQKMGEIVQEVSLLALTEAALYLRIAYFAVVIGMIGMGVFTLALQNCPYRFWVQNKGVLSLGWNVVGTLLFIVSSQPYAAVFLFVFLTIKVLMLVKKQ